MPTQTDPRIDNINAALARGGHSKAWLARTIGISESQVHRLLKGDCALSDEVYGQVLAALGKTRAVGVHLWGRKLAIPANVYRGEVDRAVAARVFDDTWMEAWVREHGERVLVREATLALELEKAKAANL